MPHKYSFILFFTLLSNGAIFAQNTRISDHNTIGWYSFTGTFKLSARWGLHTEYQWRREDLITNWQQSLLRLGVNYQALEPLQLRVGYGWAETFAYGDYPINSFGKDFTEHRIFEMATLTDKVSSLNLSHRFMLEQRWVGRYSDASLEKEDEFLFLNRLRYMFRMQLPLKGRAVVAKTPYVTLYDEIFIGFGKNVKENIFDQNRLGLLFGYKFNNTFNLEAGYLNQVMQLGREVQGRNVFQYNNGIVVNAVFNFDLTSQAAK